MDRPYSRYSPTTDDASGSYGNRRTGGYTDVETAVIDGPAGYRRSDRADYRTSYRNDYGDVQDYDGYDRDVQDYDDYDGGDHDDYPDDIREYYEPIDRRWIWVAGVAGAILLVAVICTVVILGGGDSGSVSKTVAPPLPTTALPTTTAPSVVAAPPPLAPAAPLSPETVTTIAPSPTASAAPAPLPTPVPVEGAPSARTVTYQVTGTRSLIDLVTIVYTDAQGALQTDFNVALPWTRTVTLNPGVDLKSVTATSLTGQLNCAITDAAGATIVAQSNNSMLATCTR